MHEHEHKDGFWLFVRVKLKFNEQTQTYRVGTSVRLQALLFVTPFFSLN